ncbi:hypothetical protein PR048_005163 [Dryococelus australis]|uniref:Uncharacterized protein n=1 Tax=Dryococelus australis TaxID=614101 RepID=A0ABQ9I7X2_9NEOP|nr:hypothetical protein PR048_005163 [Dryococelus australis]
MGSTFRAIVERIGVLCVVLNVVRVVLIEVCVVLIMVEIPSHVAPFYLLKYCYALLPGAVAVDPPHPPLYRDCLLVDFSRKPVNNGQGSGCRRAARRLACVMTPLPWWRYRWVWRRRKNVLVRQAGTSALRDASRELGKILGDCGTTANGRTYRARQVVMKYRPRIPPSRPSHVMGTLMASRNNTILVGKLVPLGNRACRSRYAQIIYLKANFGHRKYDVLILAEYNTFSGVKWTADRGEKQNRTFCLLKEKLFTLQLPHIEKQFILQVDATLKALGSVLCQELDNSFLPVSYANWFSGLRVLLDLNSLLNMKKELIIGWQMHYLECSISINFGIDTACVSIKADIEAGNSGIYEIRKVRNFNHLVKEYLVCQRAKPHNDKIRSPYSDSVATFPWERVYLNVFDPLPPTSTGLSSILVVVDNFITFRIFSVPGSPVNIVTNSATYFVSAEIKNLAFAWGLELIQTTQYVLPKANTGLGWMLHCNNCNLHLTILLVMQQINFLQNSFSGVGCSIL